MRQSFAGDPLENQERNAINVVEVMEGDNIWMSQSSERHRFASQAFAKFRLVFTGVSHKFQRNVTAEPGIVCSIHDAHATFARFFQHAKTTKHLARFEHHESFSDGGLASKV